MAVINHLIIEKLKFWLIIIFRLQIPRSTSFRGSFGEWYAAKSLKKKGYKIIARNWRSTKDKRLELDLVAIDQECLVFVEVRARSGSSFINGWQSVSTGKFKALKKAISRYLIEIRPSNTNYRLDIIEIDFPEKNENQLQSYHHENIAIFKR